MVSIYRCDAELNKREGKKNAADRNGIKHFPEMKRQNYYFNKNNAKYFKGNRTSGSGVGNKAFGYMMTSVCGK